jgi:5-formyltetrahydrofolate cyclo-ligase
MLEEYRRARMVHIYVSSLNNEVDTIGLIYRMFEEGKLVVVPCCSGSPDYRHPDLCSAQAGDPSKHNLGCLLRHIRIDSLDTLKPRRFGVMEPDYLPEREVAPAGLDVIIAPVLAFDRSGGRIGFGGGYYDGLFAESGGTKIGLAYSFQEVPKVPREPHDRALDIIVTEKETIRVR